MLDEAQQAAQGGDVEGADVVQSQFDVLFDQRVGDGARGGVEYAEDLLRLAVQASFGGAERQIGKRARVAAFPGGHQHLRLDGRSAQESAADFGG